MKVFFDHRIFLLQKYGGISRYIVNLNKLLNQEKINSKICAPITINHYLNAQNENKINHFHFNKIYRYCTKLLNLYNDTFTTLYLKQFKPDIVHLTYYKKYFKLKKKFPVVLTVYDLIHERFYKEYNLPKLVGNLG